MSEKSVGKNPHAGPNRQMLRRTLFLMSVCGIAAFLPLLGRLYQLQIVDHSYYEQLAIGQQLREAVGSADRGSIYDSKMRPLAVSASVDNVYVSPAEIRLYGEDEELIARGLSEILDLPYEEVRKKCGESASWYVTIRKKVEREQADGP